MLGSIVQRVPESITRSGHREGDRLGGRGGCGIPDRTQTFHEPIPASRSDV